MTVNGGSPKSAMMARRVLSVEPVATDPAPGPAPPNPLARPAPPSHFAGADLSLRAVASATARKRHPADRTALSESPETGSGLKVSKGIAVGVLLAIPFWVALAVWLLW